MKCFIEVSDCHHIGERLDMGYQLEIVRHKKDHAYDCVELENGVWLRGCGDGRYYNSDKDKSDEKWACVMLSRYDEDGEYDQGELLGYTIVS